MHIILYFSCCTVLPILFHDWHLVVHLLFFFCQQSSDAGCCSQTMYICEHEHFRQWFWLLTFLLYNGSKSFSFWSCTCNMTEKYTVNIIQSCFTFLWSQLCCSLEIKLTLEPFFISRTAIQACTSNRSVLCDAETLMDFPQIPLIPRASTSKPHSSPHTRVTGRTLKSTRWRFSSQNFLFCFTKLQTGVFKFSLPGHHQAVKPEQGWHHKRCHCWWGCTDSRFTKRSTSESC